MTKIRFFIKGARAMLDVVLVFTIWALAEKNDRLDNELKDLKSKKYMPYSYKKYPKSGSIPNEKVKYPIGFAPAIDVSEDDND